MLPYSPQSPVVPVITAALHTFPAIDALPGVQRDQEPPHRGKPGQRWGRRAVVKQPVGKSRRICRVMGFTYHPSTSFRSRRRRNLPRSALKIIYLGISHRQRSPFGASDSKRRVLASDRPEGTIHSRQHLTKIPTQEKQRGLCYRPDFGGGCVQNFRNSDKRGGIRGELPPAPPSPPKISDRPLGTKALTPPRNRGILCAILHLLCNCTNPSQARYE
jgi:hypothetical protein